jgi:hypothetical protein
MDRPKRTIKPTLKVRENDDAKLLKKTNVPKVVGPKAKKAIDNANIVINDAPRTIYIDIPPMNLGNPKLVADYGRIDHPYWVKNFIVIDDFCTDFTMDIISKFEINFLPASFMEGIPILDIRPEFFKPIKQAPLYSKLVNGDYHTATSKSDKNIANTVKFFRNNFKTLADFKDDDNLSWIVIHHRLITAEILSYSLEHKSSVSTIKSKFNALTRILRIAYETKAYPLYEKYSALVLFLRYHFDSNDWDNELNDFEKKKFIDFNEVLKFKRNYKYNLKV